jgi:predicted nucleic acid-binding protein
LEARRCAQSIGQSLIGTIGVVLRAKRRGIIETARPVIEHLRRVGLYASDQLIEQALAHLGE